MDAETSHAEMPVQKGLLQSLSEQRFPGVVPRSLPHSWSLVLRRPPVHTASKFGLGPQPKRTRRNNNNKRPRGASIPKAQQCLLAGYPCCARCVLPVSCNKLGPIRPAKAAAS